MNILQNSLVTLVALIWLLPSLSSHIHINEIFLPNVCFKVPYKLNIQQYSLVTLVTLVWFLPSMSPNIHVNEMFFHHYASSYTAKDLLYCLNW